VNLTVLGSAASYPGAGRACAGYLLEADGAALLLDCGNGVLGNLGRVLDPLALDAVFVTHGHVDHFADVYAMQAALRYAPDGPAAALPLHLPPGLFERMGAVLTEHGRAEFAEAFEVSELADGARASYGAVTVTARGVAHSGDTFALVAEAGGARLVYTADATLDDALRVVAAGADVILADATLPEPYRGRAPHMTAAEAGTLAAGAGAHTLVLTHLWPTVNRDAAAAEASAVFGGRVIVAEELDVIDIEHEEGT